MQDSPSVQLLPCFFCLTRSLPVAAATCEQDIYEFTSTQIFKVANELQTELCTGMQEGALFCKYHTNK